MKKFLLLLFTISLTLIISSCSFIETGELYSETTVGLCFEEEIEELYEQVVSSECGYVSIKKEKFERFWDKGVERKIENTKDPIDKYVVYDCENGGKAYVFYKKSKNVDITDEASFSMKKLSKKDFENVKIGKTTKADIEKIDPATKFTYCKQSKTWDHRVDKCSRHFTRDGILYILYEKGKDKELIVKDLKYIYEDVVDQMLEKDLL